jgi:hypothetical protein
MRSIRAGDTNGGSLKMTLVPIQRSFSDLSSVSSGLSGFTRRRPFSSLVVSRASEVQSITPGSQSTVPRYNPLEIMLPHFVAFSVRNRGDCNYHFAREVIGNYSAVEVADLGCPAILTTGGTSIEFSNRNLQA